MTRRPSATRTVKRLTAAGLPVSGVEVTPDGGYRILIGEEREVKPLDQWLQMQEDEK